MYSWSKLDEKRFGLKTAKLSINSEDLDIPALVKSFKKQGGQLFIVRCNSILNKGIFELQKQGFFLTDTMLTFSINPSHFKEKKKKVKGLDICLAKSEDSEALAVLSQKAFKAYKGHYHNNPSLDDQKCSEVYSDWASQLPLKKEMADAVFIAKIDGAFAGFASLKIADNKTAKAGLLGVDPEYRGKGISQHLHLWRFNWCQQNSLEEILVETSLNNKAYINILAKTGFKFISSIQIFHLNVPKIGE